jgi:hypothetical protein
MPATTICSGKGLGLVSGVRGGMHVLRLLGGEGNKVRVRVRVRIRVRVRVWVRGIIMKG